MRKVSHGPPGWQGDGEWSCPREEGSPGGGEALWRGRGEEQGDLLSPVPASA